MPRPPTPCRSGHPAWLRRLLRPGRRPDGGPALGQGGAQSGSAAAHLPDSQAAGGGGVRHLALRPGHRPLQTGVGPLRTEHHHPDVEQRLRGVGRAAGRHCHRLGGPGPAAAPQPCARITCSAQQRRTATTTIPTDRVAGHSAAARIDDQLPSGSIPDRR